MNSIDAMESEIRLQPEGLSEIGLAKRSSPILFIGSGDSFAACFAAQQFSRGEAVCCHPLDLVQTPEIAKGRTVCIVSVSGRTKANIEAARISGKAGFRTIAVTANTTSALAKSCDEVIHLKFRNGGVPTAGTVSFSTSLLTCISLIAETTCPRNVGKLLRAAEDHASSTVHRMGKIDSCFVLGNDVLHPIALYGSLKLNEVLGIKAYAYPAEEFCHSPLFSAGHGDGIIILDKSGDSSLALAGRLGREGYNAAYTKVPEPGLQGILYATFLVQMITLKMAQKLGLKECRFLEDKAALKMSSDFIY